MINWLWLASAASLAVQRLCTRTQNPLEDGRESRFPVKSDSGETVYLLLICPK